MIVRLLLVLCLISSFSIKAADKIVVGTVERPPFAFNTQDKKLTGFSVELWEHLTDSTKLDFEWKEYQQFSDMVDEVKSNKINLAIANISVTAERENFADFSQPIFSSGMAIAVKKSADRSMFSVIWESGILLFLAGAFVLLLAIAHVVWFFERGLKGRRHDYFRDDYIGGIWDAFWWAFIIMTMGGFENEVPQKKLNRVIAMFWIIVSLFFISTLTAKITTALTVAELQTGIEGYKDLANKRVGVTSGSSHQKFMNSQNITTTSYDTLDELYADLKDNKLDAIVADYPILSYYVKNSGSEWMQLAGDVFNRDNYAILFPEKSPYIEAVNKALLRLKEDGTYKKLHTKYFGASN